MKLLSRYNRVNVLATILLLLVSGGCYYFIIHSVLINQLDNDLKVEEQEIIDYVRLNNSLPNPSDYKDQKVSFLETTGIPVQRSFSSLNLFSKQEKSSGPSRQIVFPIRVSGKNYRVAISKSQEETEDLIQLILLITLAMVLLLLLVLFIINRFLLNKLWRPFNSTLQSLKKFNLSGNHPLQLEDTHIKEFTDLNDAVTVMGNRVTQDYSTLKHFTENASHEMQTPLAIINSKLDVLIQDKMISEFQLQQVQGIYNALDRLSNLNQSLLLLTRIENKQFRGSALIALDELVSAKLQQFEELLESNHISLSLQLQKTGIRCNSQLAETLISNLLTNAIRYNKPGGTINIVLNGNSFWISNSSFVPALDNSRLFQRFYRHADSKQEGNGLGLSIVKQICDMAGFSISYVFNKGQHEFLLQF